MKHKLWSVMFTALLLAWVMPTMMLAQDDDKQSDEKDLSTQLKDLREELSDAIIDLRDEMSAAEDEDARKEIIEKRRVKEKEMAEKIIAMAVENDDDDLELSYLTWLISKTKGEARDMAFDKIVSAHIESDDLGALAGKVGRAPIPEPAIEDFLRKLIEKSPHDEVKGAATMAVIGMISKLETLSDSQISRYTESIGEPFTEYVEKWSEGKGDEEVSRLLEVCVNDYADVKGSGRQTIGQMAQAQLNQMNLQVGRVAPDIEGEDLDNESFKLSDYRGKVVMLDFWGDW